MGAEYPQGNATAGGSWLPNGDSGVRGSPNATKSNVVNDGLSVLSPNYPAVCNYGRYEVLGRLAVGGMAEVLLARDVGQHETTRLIALKRILPHMSSDQSFVGMFLDEARLAMQINHPNICHIYEFGELEGSYFIAMEWVHGSSLNEVLNKTRKGTPLPVPVVCRVISQVADALDYAHKAKNNAGESMRIVHRDVSPHNIMVRFDGVVKLLDFGIAKATTQWSQTQSGVVKGKFAYMSPEQCLGRALDNRSDVFSLASCFYEALTGKSPFKRKADIETMRAVVRDQPKSVRELRPDIPVGLEQVIMKALSKDLDTRFQTAGEFSLAIERYLSQSGSFVRATHVSEFVTALFPRKAKRGPLAEVVGLGSVGSASASNRSSSAASGASASGTVPPPVPATRSMKKPGSDGGSKPSVAGVSGGTPASFSVSDAQAEVEEYSGVHVDSPWASSHELAIPKAPRTPADVNDLTMGQGPSMPVRKPWFRRWSLWVVFALGAGVIAWGGVVLTSGGRSAMSSAGVDSPLSAVSTTGTANDGVTVTEMVIDEVTGLDSDSVESATGLNDTGAQVQEGALPTLVEGETTGVPSERGSLTVEAAPKGSTVTVNDQKLVTPATLELTPGKYEVKVSHEGYQTKTKSVRVRAGGEARLDVELRAAPKARGSTTRARRVSRAKTAATSPPAGNGRLTLVTDPPGKVYVGGRLLGTTPLRNVSVPSGPLRLRIVVDGMTYIRSVRVGNEDSARAFFKLE